MNKELKIVAGRQLSQLGVWRTKLPVAPPYSVVPLDVGGAEAGGMDHPPDSRLRNYETDTAADPLRSRATFQDIAADRAGRLISPTIRGVARFVQDHRFIAETTITSLYQST